MISYLVIWTECVITHLGELNTQVPSTGDVSGLGHALGLITRCYFLFYPGISRDNWHKRRKTGGKRKPVHKKRKYELGRPPSNTKVKISHPHGGQNHCTHVSDVNTSLGWSFLIVLVEALDPPMLGFVIVTLTHGHCRKLKLFWEIGACTWSREMISAVLTHHLLLAAWT